MTKKIKEQWKKITNYSRYAVSNLGRVKSLAFERVQPVVRDRSKDRVCHYKEKILTQNFESTGYLHVCLENDNGEWKFVKVHQLVACAFLDFELGSSADVTDNNRIIVDHRNNNRRR